MKVLNLRCGNDHAFEGWFASEDEFTQQRDNGLLRCPLCDDAAIARMPSAPRLNISGAREPAAVQPAAAPDSLQAVPADVEPLQAAWLRAVRGLMERTEDVGERFTEEARRIHYGESEQRGIRGQATPEQREALREEGIETLAIPLPPALKGPVQ